jgi:trehalose/maltose hydrolase-like predicted phosphorylase
MSGTDSSSSQQLQPKAANYCNNDGDDVSKLNKMKRELEITKLELEIKDKELDVKAKELDVKSRELDIKKRTREIEYEFIDKSVDRYYTLFPSGSTDDEIDGILKAKYRRMVQDA